MDDTDDFEHALMDFLLANPKAHVSFTVEDGRYCCAIVNHGVLLSRKMGGSPLNALRNALRKED
jgi:hypothetical protein